MYLWMAVLAMPVFLVGSTQDPDPLDAAPFTSAIVCGKCHTDIYSAWSGNLHSKAATDPLFLKALAEAEVGLKERAREFCLPCHAPTTTLTRDYAMRRNITKEGVTCDFCHSMVESHPGEAIPYTLDVGGPTSVKRGPYKDADSSEHGVAYSPLHVSAELCASCHEFTGPNGVPILSTYSEYKEGPYPARAVPCQGCHMPLVMANVVDPKVKRDPRAFINLHRMPGGHAVDQLHRGVLLDWDQIRRSPGRLEVRVALSNIAGHRVPTGMPTRKLSLEVEARSSAGRVYKDRVEYQKIVVDEAGLEVKKDGEMFTRAHSIRLDNRLRPGEQRVEGFFFPIATTDQAELTARLVYTYAPLGTPDSATRITFATITKTYR